jgi:muconolactone delta-isomerase
MMFAILTEADPKDLPLPEYLQSVERGHAYLREQMARGVVREAFVRAGMAGGLWLVSAESRAEVDELLRGNPTYAYARYRVLPLHESQDGES